MSLIASFYAEKNMIRYFPDNKNMNDHMFLLKILSGKVGKLYQLNKNSPISWASLKCGDYFYILDMRNQEFLGQLDIFILTKNRIATITISQEVLENLFVEI